jgi:hypothetical protein
VIAVLLSYGISTFAKYITEELHGYYLNAKHFYFTSNRLTRNTATYQVNNWSGVGSFNISFDLLSEKNSYVYSEFDIPYTVSVTCPNDVICTLDKTSGTIYNSSTSHSDTVTVSVNPSRSYSENERLSIYIEAQSTSPYVETLSSRFEYIVGKQGVSYEIDDEANRVYMLLKVTNAINFCKVVTAFGNYSVNDLIDNGVFRTLQPSDQAKCVSKYIDLSFDPNVVILDTTSNIINDATYTSTTINGTSYVNSLSFTIDPLSTKTIKFYKKNNALDYTYPIVNNSSIVTVNIHD